MLAGRLLLSTISSVTVLATTVSCSAPAPAPRSLCDLPRGPSIKTWTGTNVRWNGAIIDGRPHGLAFVTEPCSGGLGISKIADSEENKLLDQLDAYRFQNGLIRIEFSGRIVIFRERAMLEISKIHSVSFDAMSEDEERSYWEARYLN